VALLFNNTTSTAHGCFVSYRPATNLLYLENDGGTGELAGIAPGSAGSVSNSQCTLLGTGSSYSASGSTATLNVALTFSGTFLAPNKVYLYAAEANTSASNSGWVTEGTWGASAGPPTVVSLAPNSGSGTSQTFTAVYSDPNGAADLATVALLFNTTVSTAHGCFVIYTPATKLLYLENDDGTGFMPGVAPGSAGSVSNSQCTVAGTGSSYGTLGNNATLNVAITFSNTFVVPTKIYLYAAEAKTTGNTSGWVKEGTWTP
jgi:hypothetical protein